MVHYDINSIPAGSLQNILTVVGALLGILVGVVMGRISVYYRVNKANNFAADDEHEQVKPNKVNKSLCSLLGVPFFVFGMMLGGFSMLCPIGTPVFAATLIIAILFVAVSVLLFATALKPNDNDGSNIGFKKTNYHGTKS